MDRKIVVINQAANCLTIGFANALKQRFDEIALIIGSVHVQGEDLDRDIEIHSINHWHKRPAWKGASSYLIVHIKMWLLLITKYRRFKVFLVSVPSMGYLLNVILSNQLSMVIWDIYPDVFKFTGLQGTHPEYKHWSKLDQWSSRAAWRVFTISDAMAASLYQYVNRDRMLVYPMWSILQEYFRVRTADSPFVREHNLDGNLWCSIRAILASRTMLRQ